MDIVEIWEEVGKRERRERERERESCLFILSSPFSLFSLFPFLSQRALPITAPGTILNSFSTFLQLCLPNNIVD
jgi:hypothetical protein